MPSSLVHTCFAGLTRICTARFSTFTATTPPCAMHCFPLLPEWGDIHRLSAPIFIRFAPHRWRVGVLDFTQL